MFIQAHREKTQSSCCDCQRPIDLLKSKSKLKEKTATTLCMNRKENLTCILSFFIVRLNIKLGAYFMIFSNDYLNLRFS